jgi:hypothetical protein
MTLLKRGNLETVEISFPFGLLLNPPDASVRTGLKGTY